MAEETTVQSAEKQVVAFQLNREIYGIDVQQVQSIEPLASVTRLPNVPSYVKGVMNLRGNVIPVVDLREKFGMPVIAYNEYHRILVVESGEKRVGLIVDEARDVVNLPHTTAASFFAPAPIGKDFDESFIQGRYYVENNLITLLNLDQMLVLK